MAAQNSAQQFIQHLVAAIIDQVEDTAEEMPNRRELINNFVYNFAVNFHNRALHPSTPPNVGNGLRILAMKIQDAIEDIEMNQEADALLADNEASPLSGVAIVHNGVIQSPDISSSEIIYIDDSP